MNQRLSFGHSAATPFVDEEGIALAAGESGNVGRPVMIHGCCKIKKADFSWDKKEIPAGIFVTAVELFNQTPAAAHLIREGIVFEDDVIDTGEAYVTCFSFNLFETLGIEAPPFAFMVHASVFRHVSNCLWIKPGRS